MIADVMSLSSRRTLAARVIAGAARRGSLKRDRIPWPRAASIRGQRRAGPLRCHAPIGGQPPTGGPTLGRGVRCVRPRSIRRWGARPRGPDRKSKKAAARAARSRGRGVCRFCAGLSAPTWPSAAISVRGGAGTRLPLLPRSDATSVGRQGLRGAPAGAPHRIYSLLPLAARAPLHVDFGPRGVGRTGHRAAELAKGLEPPTTSLQMRCSTN